MVSGAYVPKVVLELERTAYVLNVWTASPPGRSSRLRGVRNRRYAAPRALLQVVVAHD